MLCTYPGGAGLKVGGSVGASTGVVVLLKVRLEGGGAGTVVGLVAQCSTGVEVEVVVVGRDLVLALLHAPENKSNASQEKSAADAADHAANDLLVGVAQTAIIAAVVGLRGWWVGNAGLAGGNGDRACASRGDFELGSVAFRGEDSYEDLRRRRHEGAGADDGGGANRLAIC